MDMFNDMSYNPASRAIYNINTCFICHISAIETTLQRCGACKMISYCGEAHQKQDWKYHKKFCGVIQKVKKELDSRMFQDNLEYKQVWCSYRCIFVKKCEIEMQRKLEPYEVQMISFPKRCEVCRNINSNIICRKCLCVNYCSEEHRDRDSEFHTKNCDDLKLAMDVGMSEPAKIDNALWVWSLRKGILKLPRKITDFINSSVIMGKVRLSAVENRRDEILISTNVSYPLSLVKGISLLNFEVKNKLVVHVVGSELPETANVQMWEIIVHIYPQIEHLSIFFIGPEVCLPLRQDMCTSCKKIFKFECIQELYHDFVKFTEYQKPDIVCTFNPGFYYYKESNSRPWQKTLPLLFENAPLIMTSYNKLESQLDKEILLNVNPDLVIKTMKNPFASLMPLRSMEDSVVSYSNYFISIIFKDSSKN